MSEPPVEETPIEVTHRRAPRYGRFILTGLLAGAVIACLLAIVSRGWSPLAVSETFWLLLLTLGPLGMLAGAATALLLDRRSLRRAARQGPAGPQPAVASTEEPCRGATSP